jgi:WD40 repeat protein
MGRLGQFLRSFQAHDNPREVSLAMSARGDLLVTSGADDSGVVVWDTVKFTEKFRLKSHVAGSFKCIAISNDSRYVSSFCRDTKSIITWDLTQGGQPVKVISAPAISVLQVRGDRHISPWSLACDTSFTI